jgi:hypothetical protein
VDVGSTGLWFMGSFDLQQWTRIGAMNLRFKTLLHMQQSFAQA